MTDTTSKQPENALDYLDYVPGVPERRRDLFLELAKGTDAICDAYLDEEYRELCRQMAASIVHRVRLKLKGRVSSWVAGIVHAVGWVNFLTDRTQPLHMTNNELAKRCGVSKATMCDKSRRIRKYLKIGPLDVTYCRRDRQRDNPLVWMFEVNGFIVDLRSAPRELQELAFEQGLIPFIPADEPPVPEPTKDESTTPEEKPAEDTPPVHDLPFFDIPEAFPPEEKKK